MTDGKRQGDIASRSRDAERELRALIKRWLDDVAVEKHGSLNAIVYSALSIVDLVLSFWPSSEQLSVSNLSYSHARTRGRRTHTHVAE